MKQRNKCQSVDSRISFFGDMSSSTCRKSSLVKVKDVRQCWQGCSGQCHHKHCKTGYAVGKLVFHLKTVQSLRNVQKCGCVTWTSSSSVFINVLTESLDVVSVGFVVVYIDSGVGSSGMGVILTLPKTWFLVGELA